MRRLYTMYVSPGLKVDPEVLNKFDNTKPISVRDQNENVPADYYADRVTITIRNS